jgi:hypothetical protein
MNKIERAFFWAGTKEITRGKCKINLETVCKPKHLGGLGILHLEKFARALRLWWPWLEWRDPTKLWVGMESLQRCGHEPFLHSTAISIGNGEIAPFWDSPWLEGEKPKDIAPLIYEAFKEKKCTVAQALHNKGWVTNIDGRQLDRASHPRVP